MMRKSIYGYSIMHLLLALATPFLILALVRCTKESLDDDLGSPVSYELKDQAMAKATGKKDPTTIKVNEWVVIQNSQSMFTSQPLVTSVIAEKVISRDDTADDVTYHLAIDIQERQDDGSYKSNTYETPICVPKTAQGCPEALNQNSLITKNAIFPKSLFKATSEGSYSPCETSSADEMKSLPEGYRVNFYNLSATSTQGPPPPLVAGDPQCGGLNPCKITNYSISYDEVLTDKSGHNERYHCDYHISPETPIFATILEKCIKFLGTVGKRKVPVEICTTVENFKFGTN